MNVSKWFAALTAIGLLGTAALQPYPAAETKARPEAASFGVLRSPGLEAVRGQAQEWFKSTPHYDEQAFQAVWSQTDRPLLDLVAETLCLGSPEARELLAEARDADRPAPQQVPALIKNDKQPAFLRHNLALLYGRALTNRRVYEEALEALKTVRPEQVVDPAAYFFHKAVAEHGLLLKADATRSIARLLDDVADAPERYRMVAALMGLDMQVWKDKDLADISRKMSNVERRLDLARGGPQTQKMQKEIVARLDELIKKLENEAKGTGQGNGGQCPDGSQPGSGQPSAGGAPTQPQPDSFGGSNSGPGNVDPRKLKEIIEGWGKLPEKERAQAMTELIRNMPPAYRQMIEDFYKRSAAGGALP